MKIKDKNELRSIIEDRIENSTSNYIDLNDLDVSDMTMMDELFKGIKEPNLTLDISKWNTSNVKDMHSMFENSSFNCDISEWDVSKVTDMGFMFEISTFNGDISKWDVSKVKNMEGMFANSSFTGDISKWDVSKVKYMERLFRESVFNSDISKWDVSNVVYMEFMFYQTLFNGDLSKWNVSNVEDMYYMFRNSLFNGDISEWDVSKVESISDMFSYASFTGDISKWKVTIKNDLEKQIEENKLNIDKIKNELHLIEVVKERIEEAIANGEYSIDINDLVLTSDKTIKYIKFKEYLKTLLIPIELDNLELPDDIKEEVNKIKLIGKYNIFLKD